MPIKYKEGYKYQLVETYEIPTQIKNESVDSEYIKINTSGMLSIKNGYAWDGASGPTIDTKNSIRGSLVHDALYQTLRHQLISSTYRDYADELFMDILREAGMSRFRSWLWFNAVNKGAASAALPAHIKPILIAP